MTEESFKKSQTRSTELYDELLVLVQPWQKANLQNSDKYKKEQARDLYKKHIGDVNDPKLKDAIDKQVQLMKEQMAEAKAAPAVDDPTRKVAQRLAEMAKAKAQKSVSLD